MDQLGLKGGLAGLTRCFYADNGSTAVEVTLNLTLLIGPEGGFAAEELSDALRAGYRRKSSVTPCGPGTERYGSARGSCAPRPRRSRP